MTDSLYFEERDWQCFETLSVMRNGVQIGVIQANNASRGLTKQSPDGRWHAWKGKALGSDLLGVFDTRVLALAAIVKETTQ